MCNVSAQYYDLFFDFVFILKLPGIVMLPQLIEVWFNMYKGIALILLQFYISDIEIKLRL